MTAKAISRRELLKGSGALVVSFSFWGPVAQAFGQAAGQAGVTGAGAATPSGAGISTPRSSIPGSRSPRMEASRSSPARWNWAPV